MSLVREDLAWAAGSGCALTAVSTLALVASQQAELYSPIQKMSSIVSYLSAPGALAGATLAVLATGSYGGSGTFIVTSGAIVNLTIYTLVIFGARRFIRAIRKQAS